MGGEFFRVAIDCTYFLTYVKAKCILATVSSPSAKLWLAAKSYDIPSAKLCYTDGAA